MSAAAPTTPRAGVAPIHVALVLLSFSAGAADAFAFLALGGIFTANMTGNLILTGMFTRAEFGATLVGAIVAIVSFAGVLWAGFRFTRAPSTIDVTRPRVLRRLLLPSVALQTIAVAVWMLRPDDTALIERFVVIALAAASLALQAVGAKKLSDVDGVTTTYVTGTLTTTMQSLAEGKGGGQAIRVLSILALPVGAVAATAVLTVSTPLGPVVAWASAVLAVGILVLDRKRPDV